MKGARGVSDELDRSPSETVKAGVTYEGQKLFLSSQPTEAPDTIGVGQAGFDGA